MAITGTAGPIPLVGRVLFGALLELLAVSGMEWQSALEVGLF
jgi:hypothetical protein